MDIKEIALKVADSLRNKVDGISHMQSNQGLVRFADALIESYKAELLKEVGEPVGYLHQWIEYHPYGDTVAGEPCSAINNEGKPFDKSDTVTLLFTSDQVAAAIIKATKPLIEERDRAVKRMEAGWIEVCDSGILAFKEMNDELRAQLAAAQEDNQELRIALDSTKRDLIRMRCPDFFEGVRDGYEFSFDNHLVNMIGLINDYAKQK